MNRRLLPVLGLAFLALTWGYNWTVMKLSLRYIGPFDFATLRCLFGALALFLVMALRKQSLRPPALLPTLVLGLLQTAGFTALSNWALVAGGAGNVAVLVYTMPFWVMLFAWPLLHERIQGWQWLATACALGGLLLILAPWHMQGSLASKGLAVLCGAVWGIAVILGKKIQANKRVDLLSLTAWQMFLGALVLAVISGCVPQPPIHWTPYLFGALLYNIIPSTAIGWLVWLYLLRTLKASAAGVGSLLIPVVGVLAAALQLKEIPTPGELAGMLLIALALALLAGLSLRRPAAPVKMPLGQE